MRSVLAAVVAVLLLMPLPNAAATHDGSPEPEVPLYTMAFPVVGPNHYSNTWHAPRSGGRVHLGTDIMADKMVPVVAVASGTIGWMHDELGGRCCALGLYHDDGWASYYIHMNNDTPGTDDGMGWGFAPGIERGVHVSAGQLIGWVGDSGNAENTAPHIHFELHHPSLGPINPYTHLRSAIVLDEPTILDGDPPCPPDGECDSVAAVSSDALFSYLNEIRWNAGGPSFYYGNPGDQALMGDWDCDGTATPAMYRASSGFMYLRNANTPGVADTSFFFGNPSDIPLAGDFDGDGCDTLSIYRPSEARFYISNTLGGGPADYFFDFGNPGDKPFVGDFNGDGIDTMGLHRESTGFVYFRDSNDTGIAHFEFFYGDPGDMLVAGDWDGNGSDTVAVYRPSNGVLYVKLANTAGYADVQVPIGLDWQGIVVSPANPGIEFATDATAALESCVTDAVNAARTGRTHVSHSSTYRHAGIVAMDMAAGREPNSFARAYDARMELQAEKGISYSSEGRAVEGPTDCAALAAHLLEPGTSRRAFLLADPNVFVDIRIAISEGSAYVGVVAVRSRGKYYYETQLGRSLTNTEYELLLVEGVDALAEGGGGEGATEGDTGDGGGGPPPWAGGKKPKG